MRPIKLTMSAFEAYAGLTEIDMDSLGKSGIYLICGDTGAGKTTIFDAICYALYDETSGGVRTPKMLRSKYADEKDETYVILEFEYDGKTYKIKRNPEYERPVKRGEGMTTQLSGCELTLPDGRVIVNKNAVREEVERIIGVNKAQFSQIAMIAQGDFMSLIHAPTTERTEIFRRLFDTQKYIDLQKKLKEKNSQAKEEYERTGKAIELYIKSLAAADEDLAEREELQKLKNKELPLAETEPLCQRIILLDKERSEKLAEKKTAVSEELKQKRAEMTKAEITEKNKREFDNIRLSFEKFTVEAEKASLELAEAVKRKPEAEELAGLIAVEEKSLAGYDEYDNINKKLKLLEQTLAAKKKEQEKLSGSIENKNRECAELESECQTLKKSGENLLELKQQRDNAEVRLKTVKTALSAYDEYFAILQKYRRESKTLEKYQQYQAEYQKEYDRLYIAFLDGQAGIMGSRLEKGKPCPVCGSCNHPNPAKRVNGVPTEAELKESETALAKAKEKTDSRRIVCTELATAGKTKADLLKVQLKELIGTDKLDGVKESLTAEMAVLQAVLNGFKSKITDEEKKVLRREELETKLIPSVKKVCEEKKTSLDSLDKEITECRAELTHRTEEAEKMRGKLKYESKSEAVKQIDKMKKSRGDILSLIDSAQKNKATLEGRKTAAASSLETLKKQLGSAADEDMEKLTGQRKELAEQTENLSAKLDEIEEKKEAVTVRISANKTALKNILKESGRQEKALARYTMVNSLYRAAVGQVGGKDKITLETFIQLYYFDRILDMANLRLLKMTNGQFEMKRPKSAANHVSHLALDIDVIDHFNNTERDIKTLSGGESFMSSLALALGLSDMIQSQSGGIKLDTMFVDEGFGTLDENALEQAIKALLELGRSDRLVGIISHREEFQSRIDKQIRVTKSPITGSKAQVIIGV